MKKITKKSWQGEWPEYVVFAFVAVLWLLVFSTTTSPLYEMSGGDSMIYRLVAQGWLDGDIPYRDFFDNKGPYLYLIDALGIRLTGGIAGIFLLQTVNLTIALCLLYRIGLLFVCRRSYVYMAIGLSLVMLTGLVEGGNLTEEWSLNFVLLPVWLFLKHATGADSHHRWTNSLIYGACFGVIALIRINNACVLAAVFVAVAQMYIGKKQWLSLLKNILAALAGFALAVTPILVYFASHGALDDLIYATYTFNFIYTARWGEVVGKPWFYHAGVNFLYMLPLFFLAYSVWHGARRDALKTSVFVFLNAACVFFFMAYIGSTGYSHYFVTMLPLFFFFALFVCEEKIGWRKYVLLVLALIPTLRFLVINTVGRRTCFDESARHEKVVPVRDMIMRHVPEEEYGEIFTYGLSDINGLFLDLKQAPKGKYLFFTDLYSVMDEKIARERQSYMDTATVRWIVAGRQTDEHEDAFDRMLENYTAVDSISGCILYRRSGKWEKAW